jgi:hypothetical protein
MRVGRIALIGYVIVGLTAPVTIFYRGTVLERLQHCAREVPTSGSRPVDSPCATLGPRVLVLAGISVTQLTRVLGPSQYCFDADPMTGRWRHSTCWAPAWSFYYLPVDRR